MGEVTVDLVLNVYQSPWIRQRQCHHSHRGPSLILLYNGYPIPQVRKDVRFAAEIVATMVLSHAGR